MSFALKNGVLLYGGFDGTEILRSDRDPLANPTILSGDIGAAGVSTDNSYHVVSADGTVTASAILDGFTIAGGRADGAAAPEDRGGGLFSNGGSPRIIGSLFAGNYAADRGGAARIESGSPSFLACTFQSNSAGVFGGGALSAGSVGSLIIERAIFRANSVGNSTGGGAIHATNNTSVVNSLFVQNSPNAVIFVQDGNTFRNSTFTGNSGYGDRVARPAGQLDPQLDPLRQRRRCDSFSGPLPASP